MSKIILQAFDTYMDAMKLIHRMCKGNIVMQGFQKRFPQTTLDGITGGCD